MERPPYRCLGFLWSRTRNGSLQMDWLGTGKQTEVCNTLWYSGRRDSDAAVMQTPATAGSAPRKMGADAFILRSLATENAVAALPVAWFLSSRTRNGSFKFLWVGGRDVRS